MMTPADHAQLFQESAKYLEVPDIERGTVPAKSARLAARARQAAEEIEGRRVTPKQLKELANLIGNAEPDTDHDCLGIALATYFESSRHRPDGDPPCDEDGLDGWTQWVMARTNEMLMEAAKSVLARQAAEEIEGRRDHDFSVDDLIDQEWKRHSHSDDFGNRLMGEDAFECAVRQLLARFGGGEVE